MNGLIIGTICIMWGVYMATAGYPFWALLCLLTGFINILKELEMI